MMAAMDMNRLRGELRHDEPMSRHTSWRVGGPARRFYLPADVADLAAFLSQLPDDEPIYWVGLGSNLLVRDGGLAGTVVCTSGVLAAIERIDQTAVRPVSRTSTPTLSSTLAARARPILRR